MVRYTGDPTTEIPAEARELLKHYRPGTADEKRLDDLISYLETTTTEAWCVDVVRVEAEGSHRTQNCVFGHIFDWGQLRGDGSDRDGNAAWEWFEELWSSTFAAYPVNDGKIAYYQQPTARERSIAYLRDLRSGIVPSTYESMYWDYYGHDIEAVREDEAQ